MQRIHDIEQVENFANGVPLILDAYELKELGRDVVFKSGGGQYGLHVDLVLKKSIKVVAQNSR